MYVLLHERISDILLIKQRATL